MSGFLQKLRDPIVRKIRYARDGMRPAYRRGVSKKFLAPFVPLQRERIETVDFSQTSNHGFGIAGNTDSGCVGCEFEAAGREIIGKQRNGHEE